MTPRASLRAIKILHTAVWAFFAGCILLVPVYAWWGGLRAAAVLIGVVFLPAGGGGCSCGAGRGADSGERGLSTRPVV